MHRGYRSPHGDGYGRRAEDCYVGQGSHSRSFICFDTQGALRHVCVKISRARPDSVTAMRTEAGALQSLLQLKSDARQSKYFVRLLDSFEVGSTGRGNSNAAAAVSGDPFRRPMNSPLDWGNKRFGLVYEEHGPSLGYVLSCLGREPLVDETYDFDQEYDDDDDEGEDEERGGGGGGETGGVSDEERKDGDKDAAVARRLEEGRGSRRNKKNKRGGASELSTGYTKQKEPRRRRGPVPRLPLPLDYTIEITRQLCDACDFLHRRAGMIHGDVTPDNICFLEPPASHTPGYDSSESFLSKRKKASSHSLGSTPQPAVGTGDGDGDGAALKPWERGAVGFGAPLDCLPPSPRIKLVDLGGALFIPVAGAAKPKYGGAYREYNDPTLFSSL